MTLLIIGMVLGAILTICISGVYSYLVKRWNEAIRYEVLSRACKNCKYFDGARYKCTKNKIDVIHSYKTSCTDWSDEV